MSFKTLSNRIAKLEAKELPEDDFATALSKAREKSLAGTLYPSRTEEELLIAAKSKNEFTAALARATLAIGFYIKSETLEDGENV